MAPIYITINPEKTGQNIVTLMRFRGLRVKDIQEACGFEKPQAIYKWIHGDSIPSIDNLLVLAKLFSTNVEGILAAEDALPSFHYFRAAALKSLLFAAAFTCRIMTGPNSFRYRITSAFSPAFASRISCFPQSGQAETAE